MIGEPDNLPLELLLEDGGHLIVAFADARCRRQAADPIAYLLVVAHGSESDLEGAIRSQARDLGFPTSSSSAGHSTTVLVGRR